MPLEIPPELKKIVPYIKRAEELDKDTTTPESRLVAYYLRQYAVQLGIPYATNTNPASKVCLGTILNDLEQEKEKMNQFTREEAAFVCRTFAMNVFDKADTEDRAGNATKHTAKTFYAAQSFLQMLEQFNNSTKEGDDNDDTIQQQIAEDKKRILYCKWKATEILKAIKEGRQPTPGGYGEENDNNYLMEESNNNNNNDEQQEKEQQKPVVETVTNDNDDFGLPVVPSKSSSSSLYRPPPPATTLPAPLPPPPPPPKFEEEGTEVELGLPPPPPYSTTTSSTTSEDANRSTLSFNLPSSNMDDLPPPIVPSSSMKPQKAIGLFGGFGGVKKDHRSTTSISKAQLNDAIELTKFALAALEDKDGNLAAERLQQALSALGR